MPTPIGINWEDVWGDVWDDVWSQGTDDPVLVPVFAGGTTHTFCTPFYSEGVGTQIKGGNWRTSLPVTNMGTDRLDQFARSVDLLPTSTRAIFLFGQGRPIGATIIPKSSASIGATFRVSYAFGEGNLVSAPVHQSPILPTWPALYTAEDLAGLNVAHMYFPRDGGGNPGIVYADCMMIEWFDGANPDGYLDVHRAVGSGVILAPRNMSVGASEWINDDSVGERSESGSMHWLVRPKYRGRTFMLRRSTEKESFGPLWTMGWRLGKTGQLFFVFDRDDPAMPQRGYLCTQRELGKDEWAWSTELAKAYELEEVL